MRGDKIEVVKLATAERRGDFWYVYFPDGKRFAVSDAAFETFYQRREHWKHGERYALVGDDIKYNGGEWCILFDCACGMRDFVITDQDDEPVTCDRCGREYRLRGGLTVTEPMEGNDHGATG